MKKLDRLIKKTTKRRLNNEKKLFVREKKAVTNIFKTAAYSGEVGEKSDQEALNLIKIDCEKNGWLLIPSSIHKNIRMDHVSMEKVICVSAMGVFVGIKRAYRYKHILDIKAEGYGYTYQLT